MDKGKKIFLIVLGVCVLVFCGTKACVKKVKNMEWDNAIAKDTFTYGHAPYMEIDVEVVNGGLYIKKQ